MEASPVLFDFARPSKKRNYIRRRDDGKDETTENITSITPSSIAPPAPVGESLTANFAQSTTSIKPSSQDSEGEQGLGLAEILRRRKNIARPKKGLDIAEIVPKVARDAKTEKPKSEEKAVKNTTEQELAAVVNRFTHQTGQVMDVDKHMYALPPPQLGINWLLQMLIYLRVAYIESEMEKRRRAKAGADSSNTSQQSHPSSSSQSSGRDASKNAFWQPTRPADRGATLGKLHEVDLGEENKIRNITRTKEATRRLEGGGEPMEDVQMDGKAGKKSYRRRRRNSQDIQRDKLVEEVLKESKRMVFTHPILKVYKLVKLTLSECQLSCTMSPRKAMARRRKVPQTTASPRNSGASSSTHSCLGGGGGVTTRTRRKETTGRNREVQSWVAAGVQGLQCGNRSWHKTGASKSRCEWLVVAWDVVSSGIICACESAHFQTISYSSFS